MKGWKIDKEKLSEGVDVVVAYQKGNNWVFMTHHSKDGYSVHMAGGKSLWDMKKTKALRIMREYKNNTQ